MVLSVDPHNMNFQLYADDQQVYLSFKPMRNSTTPQDNCINFLQNCKGDIKIWMMLNMLKLSGNKTECIMFGMKQQLAKISHIEGR